MRAAHAEWQGDPLGLSCPVGGDTETCLLGPNRFPGLHPSPPPSCPSVAGCPDPPHLSTRVPEFPNAGSRGGLLGQAGVSRARTLTREDTQPQSRGSRVARLRSKRHCAASWAAGARASCGKDLGPPPWNWTPALLNSPCPWVNHLILRFLFHKTSSYTRMK